MGQTEENNSLQQVSRMGPLAWTPVVADSAARDALYPTPVGDEKVFNKSTNQLERYDAAGKGWVADYTALKVRPRATFAKIYASVSAPSLINFMAMGDSMAEFKPRHLCAALQRTLTSNADLNAPNTANTAQQSYAGCFCGVGANSGYSLLANQFSYWISGELHQITVGGSVTWTYGGVNPTFTKLMVAYITEPGGGTFTVTVGGVLQTTINTNTGVGIGIGFYNFTQARGQSSVVIASTVGTTKLVEVHKLDDSISGINYFFSSQGGVALSDGMSTATGRANFQAYVANASLDLVTYEAKEASIEPDGSTFAFRLSQFADILDAAMPNGDKIFIASTPVASNDSDQVAQNATLNALCVSRSYIFWDGYTPVKNYATLVALGWQGDGVHPAPQCHAYLAGLLFRDMGFDRAIWGLNPRAVSNRAQASQLGSGTTFGIAAGQQLTVDTDSAGFDWQLAMARSLALTKDDVVGAGTVMSTAGAATFSQSQAGVVAAGAWLKVGTIRYLVLTFDGTTGATLSAAPTFGASSFTVRTPIFQMSSILGTRPNIIPMSFQFDTELAGPGVTKDTSTGQTFIKWINSLLTPSLLPHQMGAVYPGSYTKAQLLAIANSRKGMVCVTSDGQFDSSAGLMVARGASTTDYVPVLYGFSGVAAAHGDGAVTLQLGDAQTHRWTSPLTANRAVAFNAALSIIQSKFRIIRTAASTGAFTLDVGTGPLKSLATGQWCDVEYSTSDAAWILTAFGSL